MGTFLNIICIALPSKLLAAFFNSHSCKLFPAQRICHMCKFPFFASFIARGWEGAAFILLPLTNLCFCVFLCAGGHC